MNKISYGIGRDYLKHWGIKEALREIYQNFIDFGEYSETENKYPEGEDFTTVKITNSYIPDDLSFLRIGTSTKGDSKTSIGKYGEGLKMAFLVFLREGLQIQITTNKHIITPSWINDTLIGEILSIDVIETENSDDFHIQFTCSTSDFNEFKSGVINYSDIIFSNHHGDIVDKEKGGIYSGGLFIANISNLSKAYNIKPQFLALDRDRKTPSSWDVNWHTSRINEDYGKTQVKDLSYSDTQFIDTVPVELLPSFTPRVVGSRIEFTAIHEDTKEEVIIKNDRVVEHLKKSSFFSDAITKLKQFIAKSLGIDDMLQQFRDKHCHSAESKEDFDMILEKLKLN